MHSLPQGGDCWHQSGPLVIISLPPYEKLTKRPWKLSDEELSALCKRKPPAF